MNTNHPGSKNLIPLSKRTKEEKRKIAIMGGRASVKVRRERKTFRESLKLLLSGEVEKGSEFYKKAKGMMKVLGLEGDPTGQTLVDLGVFTKAIKGDTSAAEFIRDTIGEKPTETFEDRTPHSPIALGVIPLEKVEEAKKRKEARVSGKEESNNG